MNQSGFLPNESLQKLRERFQYIFGTNDSKYDGSLSLPKIFNIENSNEYVDKTKNVATFLDSITYINITSKYPNLPDKNKKGIYFPQKVNFLLQYQQHYPNSFPREVFDMFAKCVAELPKQLWDISKDVHRESLELRRINRMQIIQPNNTVVIQQGQVQLSNFELHLATTHVYYNGADVTGLLPQCYRSINELLNALEQS